MPLIRNISDTALLAAVYRARENEHQGPFFRDPFARQLAGERGEQIARSLAFSEKNAWSWIARTCLFDQFVIDRINDGCDMVVNLAAGLDARPYRMLLPGSLKWIEVDLPDITDYKEEILGDEEPSCVLERIRLDLADVNARRDLFRRLAARASKALIVSEGFVVYLTGEEVGSLATDLAAQPAFHHWVLDLASPVLLRMLQKKMGKPLEQAAAPLKFAPAEGPDFYRGYGWKPVDVRSFLKAPGITKRLPLMIRILSRLQRSDAYQAKSPWAGVCLLERQLANE